MALLFSGLHQTGTSPSMIAAPSAPEAPKPLGPPAPTTLHELREEYSGRKRTDILSRILAEADFDRIDSDDPAFRELLEQRDPELLRGRLRRRSCAGLPEACRPNSSRTVSGRTWLSAGRNRVFH